MNDKYKIVNLNNGDEDVVSHNDFNIFMEEKDIRTFYKFVTDEQKIVYKNDDWMVFSEE